jgi:hypothetical protein
MLTHQGYFIPRIGIRGGKTIRVELGCVFGAFFGIKKAKKIQVQNSKTQGAAVTNSSSPCRRG